MNSLDRALSGSSPRVRGTRAQRNGQCRWRRFIPACAGNTNPAVQRSYHKSVHPRVCGEHLQGPGHITQIGGSSPRVRGTLAVMARNEANGRFIPACAGNTWHRQNCFRLKAVHPRVCGEHGTGRLITHIHCGSSPRVRGTPAIMAGEALERRFIPACAGNTPHRPNPRPINPGSSPRVRGTQRRAP